MMAALKPQLAGRADMGKVSALVKATAFAAKNRGVIPESFKQDLLNRVDIVDVVARYVQLKKGGANYIGLCPFHGEKTPSFTVSPAKQFYHCFGCGAHGNAIGFLMEYAGHGLSSTRSRTSPQQVGMQVPETTPRTPEDSGRAQERETDLYDVLEKAMAFYRARAEEVAARHRLPEGPRPDRRDRRALRHRLRAGRLASLASVVPELRRQGAGRERPGHRRRREASATTASATASCSRSSTRAAR